MSSALTLARPYARAAFELAQNSQSLADWSAKLGFSAAFVADPIVADLIGNPRISAAQQIELLLPKGEARDSTYASFITLLSDNGRLTVLPQLLGLFEEHRAEAEKTLVVKLRSAAPVEAEQQQRLRDALTKRFGRTVQLDIHIEPELLGGAIIDSGDVVIDGSLRGKLARLRTGLAA